MLVLSRKAGEAIFVGDSISVRVSEVRGNRVKLCIDAPSDVRVLRSEVAAQLEKLDKAMEMAEFPPTPVTLAK